MTLYGINNTSYTTARELGRGGEGTVYELQHNAELVLKHYSEPLDGEKESKLKLMAAMRSEEIEAYAAWPIDVVYGADHKACGFVMKKLKGYLPLHHLFSPMDRKRMFHDKGYNFLVHVARNLAIAFHKLHTAGIIVGDVNEGNILLNPNGMIAFIDCDSFQIRHETGYYFCEVGVPRYTPPEMLKRSTFENVVRTDNTDNFSLAVLIFQLLFLGRHPFAGRHKGAADIDEETAIKQKQFAYSLENTKKKLSPPPDSFKMEDLPADLASLFHSAFEHETRPTASEWALALGNLSKNIATCSISNLHTYPSGMVECPWCWFRKNRGIMYFLDDSYYQANSMLGNIEQFVNGFKVQEPEKRRFAYKKPLQVKSITLPPGIRRVRNLRLATCVFLSTSIIIAFALGITKSLVFLPLVVYTYKWSPWAKRLNKAIREKGDELLHLKKKLQAMIRDYEEPADYINYQKTLEGLQQNILSFRQLPQELQNRRQRAEEVLYNEQLDDYLWQFGLDDYAIPAIGPTKKATLYNNGIRNAAQLKMLPNMKVPGIGPKNEQILMAWRRQMANDFVYVPDTYKLNIAIAKVNDEIAQMRIQLEHNIRREYQSLNFLKMNIDNKLTFLENQLEELYPKVRICEMEYDAFKKLAA